MGGIFSELLCEICDADDEKEIRRFQWMKNVGLKGKIYCRMKNDYVHKKIKQK